MDVSALLGPELLDAARALGLVAGDALDPAWFSDPLHYLGGIVAHPAQRAALFDLLDHIMPPSAVPGAPPTAKWHPLLGDRPVGNLFITVEESTAATRIGVAGRYVGTSSGAASLLVDAPLISVTGPAIIAIAGTATAPLTLTLAVPLGWTTPEHAIALAAIEIAIMVAPAASPALASASITLRGLDLDGGGPADTVLDPANLGGGSARLLLGLLHEQLRGVTGPASHLVPLLGLDGATPPFPFTTITRDPRALAAWLTALVTGSPAPAGTWLGHLAGLLGVPAPTATTGDAGAATWSVPLLAPNESSTVTLTLTASTAPDNVTPRAELGIGIGLVPAGAASVRVDVTAALLTIPLAGAGGPGSFTHAAVTVSAPADPSESLIAASPGATFSVGSVHAGLAWDGSAVSPLVEMRGVTIAGIGTFPVVDLHNALTVAGQAATDALGAAISAALASTPTGQHLAALAGLVAPASDSAAPLVDLTQLATHPTSAIAALHRAALLSTTHPWKIYFDEIAALLSIPVTAGSGTETDPWAATIADAAPTMLQLVAWNGQTSSTSTDPQQLRIGLRLAAGSAPIAGAVTIELIRADLAADGTTALALAGACRAAVTITPQASVTAENIALTATSLTATARVPFGQRPQVTVAINALSITTPGGTITVPSITYPFAAGFDVTDPASALGIGVAELELLVQALLVRALTAAFGPTGTGLAVLLGCGGIADLPADSPAAADHGGPGSLFTDPLGALHAWLGTVATGLSADGGDWTTPIVVWLAGVLAGSPSDPFPAPDPYALTGSGTYDDPWQLPLGAIDSRAALTLWLDPGGPPGAATVGADMASIDNFWTLAVAAQNASAHLPPIPDGVDIDAFGDGLQALADFLTATDGVVPVTSQIPAGGTWTTGTPVGAAHSQQPADPSVCTQVLAAVDAWAAPGTPRAILLLGSAFSDHTVWDSLLAQAEAAHPGITDAAAVFDFRVQGVAPASVDLRPVTAVADFYAADLQDDGSNDVASLVAQIGLAVDRIQSLKPSAAVAIVAHSTAGIAARAFTAANATVVKGLVTVGTPHSGAPIEPLTDPALADTLRVLAHLVPGGFGPGPLGDALTHLLTALDGYQPATAGGLPVASPYPLADFAGDGSADTGGVPALALGGPLGGTEGVDLLSALRASLRAAIAAAPDVPPTHLGYGVRVDIPLGPDSGVAADAALRLDLGSLALGTSSAGPPRAARSFGILVSLVRPGGWLAGGPAADIRVRSAQIGLSVTPAVGGLTAEPIARLHEVGCHGTTADLVTWGAPLLDEALGATFRSLTTPAPAPASSLSVLIGALTALGLVTTDAAGNTGFAADAISALAADPLDLLAPRLRAAFASSSMSAFTAAGPNAYQLALPPLPLTVEVTLHPPTIALRTDGPAGKLPIADAVNVAFSVVMPLPAMTPVVTGSLAAGPATVTYAAGELTLAMPPAFTSLPLYPAPSEAAARAAFTAAVPRLLIDTVASALLESALGGDYTVTGVLAFLDDPGDWLVGTGALGDGAALDPARLNNLFDVLGPLPGGLALTAAGADPTTIELTTATPLGGVVSLAIGAAVDRTRHLAPVGTITVQAPAAAGADPGPSLMFSVGAAGLALSVTTGGATSTAIQLLPVFDGAAALAGAAAKLLPAALDTLVSAVAPGPGPPPPLVALTLDVASALDLYDTAGGFAAHTAQLAAMAADGWLAAVPPSTRTQFVAAAERYFTGPASPLAGTLPGAFTSAGSALVWTYPLPSGIASGTLSLTAGWDTLGPVLTVHAAGVTLADGPVTATFGGGFAGGSLTAGAIAALDLAGSVGLDVAPQLALTLTGSGVTLTLVPLGPGTDSVLAVPLAPAGPLTASADAAQRLLTGWAIPLAAKAILDADSAILSTPLWNGGPTAATALSSAGIITATGGTPPVYALATPLDLAGMPGRLLRAFTGTTVTLAADPPLALTFTADAAGPLGVRLTGSIPLDSGDGTIFSLLFGRPATWLGPSAGVTLQLFTEAGGSMTFAPALAVRGLGLGVSGVGDAPAVKLAGFRLGSIDGYLAFDLSLTGGPPPSGLGGGVEIGQLGLPLNALDAGTSDNPVAASLLGSGSQPTSGDSAGANPSVDVIAFYLDQSFTVELAGQTRPVVLPVHASLGPLYIDQVELALHGTTAAEVGVDGDVKVNGFEVAVDGLALRIPFASLLAPAQWTLDLEGLSVGFDSGTVGIAGGLRKNPGPPVDYEGLLSVTLPTASFSVLAAYGRPSDTLGSYTSLFMFAAFSEPLGGPPFAFITGLGAGFGYNRQLQVPADFAQIASFPLVTAIDGAVQADPLAAFAQMATAIPPRRGSFWIAAGVRFTSFALVNTTAVIAIAVDRGFAIDVLGVSRMALPSENVALASVELALKARYDATSQTLAVQAQLTDNSYLFSHDCQLTGGFAFFVWFRDAQFVLTLGGYGPAFTVPAEFPDVPRLGFSWQVDRHVVIKGGAYFALTDSCVMAGGSLSATGSYGPVSAWFDAAVDMLVAWDPFAYALDVAVDIGGSATFEVCFIECATISVSLSVGAKLAIAGPPFHGTVTIDAYVTSVTIAFGDTAQPQNYITDWGTFAGKYLTAGDAGGSAVSAQMTKGLLVPVPPTAQAQPGTPAQPWQVGSEFTLATTTRMPATTTLVPVAGLNALDIAPMDQRGIAATHTLSLTPLTPGGGAPPPVLITGAVDHWTITPRTGLFPEATWHWVDPQHLPAGARTIQAISGLTLDAHVAFSGQSAPLSMAALTTDRPADALPLPLATTAAVAPALTAYGTNAETLAGKVAGATSAQTITASARILAGDGVFAAGRAAAGLPVTGLTPLAALSLARARSAPPLITPLTTGLTMQPPGLPAPAAVATVPPPASVPLTAPRLRAVLGSPPQPVAEAPPALHTSVTTTVAAAGTAIPRTQPPAAPVIAGARLIVVAAPDAPRPTTAAVRPRAVRNAELGAAIGPGHQQALDEAATALTGTGVTIGAGTLHLWDVPDDQGRFTLQGDAAARVISMDRGGTVLGDVEVLAPAPAPVPVAQGAARVAIACLGPRPDGAVPRPSAAGAVTMLYAPAGARAAVGWQSTSTLAQVGPASFAARGATLQVPRPSAAVRNAQRASAGVVSAADAVGGQLGVETRLPAGIEVVIIALDTNDPTAAQGDDLRIGVAGAQLGAPARVVTGARRILIYDVTGQDVKAGYLTVTVASSTAWNVAAVIGVRGQSTGWAAALVDGLPDGLVPHGPFAPGGALTVTYLPGAAA